MANSWFRMYGEMIHDPKIGKLNDAEFRLWVSLLCQASNVNNEGETDLTPDDAEWTLRCNVTETLQKLIVTNLVTITHTNTIKITNWEKRQKKSDKSNDRVKKHRQHKASEQSQEDVTLQKRYSNGLDKIDKIDNKENKLPIGSLQKKPKAGAKKHPIPKDFAFTENHKDIAKAHGLSIESEFAKFKDRNEAKGEQYVNWASAFSNWLRNAPNFARAGPKKTNEDGLNGMIFD